MLGNALKEAFKAISIISDDGKQADAAAVEKKISAAQVIMFSGCMDHQTSADAHIEGSSTGAMSWAILKVLNEHQGELTLCELLEKLRGNLSGHFQQIPQMSTSHEMPVLELKFSLI